MIDAIKGRIETGRSSAPSLDPMAQSDLETGLQTWLEGMGIDDAWEMAPALVAAGWNADEMAKLQDTFSPENLKIVLRWLASGCMAYSLLDEIAMGTERMSEIVRSVKAYSYLDQGPIQQVDLHQGLENTLVILRHKMKDGITVKREYAADLPLIEAHGSELNQVWTNILDNAVDAMQGRGEIILRTRAEGNKVIVEIQDNGPGIPAEIQKRVYEPFFTTKPPGLGDGARSSHRLHGGQQPCRQDRPDIRAGQDMLSGHASDTLIPLSTRPTMTVEDDKQLTEILTRSRKVACVGVSSNPEKPSYGIFAYLLEHGYDMIPVNPTASEILGRKAYPDLASIPEKVDIVQVFRQARRRAGGRGAGHPDRRERRLDAGRGDQRSRRQHSRGRGTASGDESLHAQDAHSPDGRSRPRTGESLPPNTVKKTEGAQSAVRCALFV